jgi:hypothetical protein
VSAPDDATGGGTSLATIPADADSGRNWRDLWRPALHLATMRSAERRARVLQHPDLAELLTRPEVGYARPDQWTGYIPPEMWCEKRNDSPRRAALVAIATEAKAREHKAVT